MMDDLVKQFVGSGPGQQAVQALTGQGFNQEQARRTVEATAASTDPNAIKGALGGMLGGAVPQQLTDQIVGEVAKKTGLDPAKAKSAVDAVLPKVLEFAKTELSSRRARTP